MLDGQRIGVVIPAAGIGTRMGTNLPKQFVPLLGKPLLIYTLEVFHRIPEIDALVLVVSDDSLSKVKTMLNEYHLETSTYLVAGGEHRQDSVFNGLKLMKEHKVDIVLVHDAVRPFVTPELVYALLEAAREYEAAIPVVRPKETIKQSSGDGFVENSIPRDLLWVVQTPQAFRFALLYTAFEKASAEKFYGTDEAMLVERIGTKVKTVESSYKNIKITTPEDFALAELWLRNNILPTTT
jgi:2-C-methyl-D-erythritol 4-phosphate cytidylyltransferase